MDCLKKEMNEYLFLEFGLDGDESLISETWPFNLRTISESPDLTVFEFHEDEPYFALVGESMNYLPQRRRYDPPGSYAPERRRGIHRGSGRQPISYGKQARRRANGRTLTQN